MSPVLRLTIRDASLNDCVLGRGGFRGTPDQVAPTQTRTPTRCHGWLFPAFASLNRRPTDPCRLFLACVVGQFGESYWFFVLTGCLEAKLRFPYSKRKSCGPYNSLPPCHGVSALGDPGRQPVG
jgi:hypothetical protein